MKLEQQCCSLELAKRLKELGVKQESLFYWLTDERDKRKPNKIVYKNFLLKVHSNYASFISAFTVAELLDLLPATIEDNTWLNYTKSLNGWGGICQRVSYDKWEMDEGAGKLLIKHVHEVSSLPYKFPEKPNDTVADLYAKMLCYLLENKLILP